MSTYHIYQTERIPSVGEAGSSTWHTQQVGHLPRGTMQEEKRPSETSSRLYTKNEDDDDDDDDLTPAAEEIGHHAIISVTRKPRQNSFDFVVTVFRAQEERAAATHPSSSAFPSLSTSSLSNTFDQAASSKADHQSAGGSEAAGGWITMPRLSRSLSGKGVADCCGKEGDEDAREVAMEEVELGLWPNAAGEQRNYQSRDVEALQHGEQTTWIRRVVRWVIAL